MIVRRPANREAVKRAREKVRLSTDRCLIEAIDRIAGGRTRIVKPGTRLSVEAVAEEAEIHRGTIYRYHPEIITKIRSWTRSGTETATGSYGEMSAAHAERLRKANEKIRQLEEGLVKALRENHLLQKELREKSEKERGNIVALDGQPVAMK